MGDQYYKYRGTKVAVIDEAGEYTHDPKRCGKFEGYKKHKRNHETVCPPCREAKRVRSAEDYAKMVAARTLTPRVFDPSKCGTTAGYQRHMKFGNDKCEPCTKARTEYMAGYREKRKAADPHWRVT